jgi:hypothetical protein
MSTPSFSYGVASIKDIRAKVTKDDTGAEKIAGLYVGDREVNPSKRFWTSLQSRFAFSTNIFRYFDHKEVFDRVASRAKNDKIRYCIEEAPEGATHRPVLLGVTNPTAPVIKYDELRNLLERYGHEGALNYTGGIVTSRHKPRVGSEPYNIVGDVFENGFVIDSPVDGFGHPSVYLSMMRLICSNGAIAYTKAFRSELSVGKTDEDIAYNLIRAMDGFNNEEGYAALKQRFESAQFSWASVRECNRLYKALASLALRGNLAKQGREVVETEDGMGEVVETSLPLLHQFHKMTGDLSEVYGMANLDTLSTKKQRVLPAACRVYDLINFMSELATHKADQAGARRLQAMIGELLGAEYDLEGTAERYTDFRDFFLSDTTAAEAKASLERRAHFCV